MNTVLRIDELRAITGYERAGDIVKCLRKQGIAVFFGRGGTPWTTLDQINAAAGQRVSGPERPLPAEMFSL